jgi:hypothetical protein
MVVRLTRSTVGARLALISLSVAIIASGCGSAGKASSTSNTISNGQVNIQLPGGSGGSGGSGTTVPLAKQSSLTQFFTAISSFQSCLHGLGVTFIGAPDSSNPSSPANDPTYIKNLTTCAAQSNILQALKNAQTAQDNLTTAQIAIENKAYLKWRTCMIGRGWGIPQPVPDSKGRLFSFGGAASGSTTGANFTPPAGQTLLSSHDLEACASVAEKAVPGSASLG